MRPCVFALVFALAAASACGCQTVSDLEAKARGARNSTELRKRLGEPSKKEQTTCIDRNPCELWIYYAGMGRLACFVHLPSAPPPRNGGMLLADPDPATSPRPAPSFTPGDIEICLTDNGWK